MMGYPVIPEIDVLVSATLFLAKREVKPYRFSPPRGKGINTQSAEKRIWEVLNSMAIQRIRFSNEGADFVGVSETECWHVKCKGSGSGKPQTQRNNFDRALASVVCYYGEKLPEGYRGARPYLGLALPASPQCLNELKRRVRQPLRKILNLWILLYEPESKSIRAVSPEDSY